MLNIYDTTRCYQSTVLKDRVTLEYFVKERNLHGRVKVGKMLKYF
jgi:hypothetical protein